MQSPLGHGRAALGTTIAGGALAALSDKACPDLLDRLELRLAQLSGHV